MVSVVSDIAMLVAYDRVSPHDIGTAPSMQHSMAASSKKDQHRELQ
jgi:hypothetical protein